VLSSVFWGKYRILLIHYLRKGATITTKYYFVLFYKVKQQLVSKRRGKLSKGILILQDNAVLQKVAIMHLKLAYLHSVVLKLQAYSIDLALSDYYLFPKLKKYPK
jgi:hypothetical protein